MTLQPCQNGSYWTKALAVKHVQEELESPYTVETCDYVDGCECTIVQFIPEKARGRPFDTVTYVVHVLCWNWGKEEVV
jgi:hypothetical protein